MVLALYPAFGVGQLARSYLVNVLVFHAWGIVYALFSVLLTAINAQSLGAMLAANSLGGWFQGARALTISPIRAAVRGGPEGLRVAIRKRGCF